MPTNDKRNKAAKCPLNQQPACINGVARNGKVRGSNETSRKLEPNKHVSSQSLTGSKVVNGIWNLGTSTMMIHNTPHCFSSHQIKKNLPCRMIMMHRVQRRCSWKVGCRVPLLPLGWCSQAGSLGGYGDFSVFFSVSFGRFVPLSPISWFPLVHHLLSVGWMSRNPSVWCLPAAWWGTQNNYVTMVASMMKKKMTTMHSVVRALIW